MDNFFEELKKQILKDDNDHLEEKGISKEHFTGENLKQPGIGVLKLELTVGEIDGKIANGVVCATAPGGVEIMGLIGIPRGELMQIFQPALMEFTKCAENLGIRVSEELNKDDPTN